MSAVQHRRGAPENLAIAVLTVGDDLSEPWGGCTEKSAEEIIELEARRAGHRTVESAAPEGADSIRRAIRRLTADRRIDAVITTGGTGAKERDNTIEALLPLFDKELPGFGEILRRIGYEEVGIGALLSRATAGLIGGKPVFCLPRAPGAAKVAMRLILPELGHIIKHARE